MGELNYDYGDPEHIKPFLEQAPLAREGAGDLDLTIRRWDGSPVDFQAPPELDELITASGARGRALAMSSYHGEGGADEGPESPSERGGSGPTVPPDRPESPPEPDSRTTEVGPLIGGTVMVGTNNTVDAGGEPRGIPPVYVERTYEGDAEAPAEHETEPDVGYDNSPNTPPAEPIRLAPGETLKTDEGTVTAGPEGGTVYRGTVPPGTYTFGSSTFNIGTVRRPEDPEER